MNCVSENSCNCNSAAERELANQPVPWNVPTLFQSLSLEWLPTLFFHLKLLISSGLSVRGEWKLYNWETLFFVCLFYSLIYTISLRILSQGIKPSALLLLKYLSHPGIVSGDWHLPDIRKCGITQRERKSQGRRWDGDSFKSLYPAELEDQHTPRPFRESSQYLLFFV